MKLSNRKKEKFLQIGIIMISLLMIVLRFLLNEKGRVTPDSIRLMRTANVFPTIDNTTTPLGYPLSLKFFTFLGFDEFWASKMLGILAYVFMVGFAWKKRFYFKETVVLGALFSYVSIFSFSLTEPLILLVVLVFLYLSRNIIIGKYSQILSIVLLSAVLILLYNIRYSALFFMGTCFLFGLMGWKKSYGKSFLYSSLIGLAFVVLYKFLFVDYFNENYVNQFLEMGLHPTSKLLVELYQGLSTSFNPFVHIANPAGGVINYGIYGVGTLTIGMMMVLFIKNPLSETEKFMIFTGIIGVLCSFFIQFFYSVDPLDYRLLSPFILPIWLVFFKKIYAVFGKWMYAISVLSLVTGFAFTWLSKGNYLENRKTISEFLNREHLSDKKIIFYANPKENIPEQIQVAELISTVNPRVYISHQAKDTLKKEVLTAYKVQTKIKIIKNKFQ